MSIFKVISKIEQYRYNSNNISNNIENDNKVEIEGKNCIKKTIFSELNVKKIGIQGTPGWFFNFNNDLDNKIMIGYTGIFEIDISNTGGDINSMDFYWPIKNKDGELIVEEGNLIVDIIYETSE